MGRQKSEKLSDTLASLYDTYAQRRLSGATSLANIGLAGRTSELESLKTGAEIGAIPRLLDTQAANEAYTRWVNDEGRRLSSAAAVMGNKFDWGVKEMPVAKPDNTELYKLIGTGISLATGPKPTDVLNSPVVDFSAEGY